MSIQATPGWWRRLELVHIPKRVLLKRLKEIKHKGWIHTSRTKNDGAVGNTLEDLLDIPENNRQSPDAGEWELKSQRADTTSLITLFHFDPEPRKPKSVVAHLLLPVFGWKHNEAGKKYPSTEMSFRATLCGNRSTDRGLKVRVNRAAKRVEIIFDPTKVDKTIHGAWHARVLGFSHQDPVIAFWPFDKLEKKCQKIKNTIFVVADSREQNGQEEFKYGTILLLEHTSFENLLAGIEKGDLFIDFDARTGHNHGTKFRIKQNSWPILFSTITTIT